jgi:hypothetical protein
MHPTTPPTIAETGLEALVEAITAAFDVSADVSVVIDVLVVEVGDIGVDSSSGFEAALASVGSNPSFTVTFR